MSDVAAPLSIHQQAEFVDYLVARCVMQDGRLARWSMLHLGQDEVTVLTEIGNRLRRMAPFEADIRRVVTGR